jgi:uncharacterized protein with HEPN domain
MNRDYKIYLQDILISIVKIEEFVDDMDYIRFINDDKTVSAVIMKLEIIGETVKNIPREVRTKHKDIPWKDMAGIRDKLIHGYFSIDYRIIWNVIKDRLPDLKSKIKKVYEEK